jgi:acetyl esterase/lipase
MASALLFTYGFVALLLTVNALRRMRSPRAPLPPLWLPAMLTASLAPFWGISRIIVGAAFAAIGGTRLAMGRLGLWMLAASIVGLVALMRRNATSSHLLRRGIATPVFKESLPTRLTGRPVPTPADLEQLDEIPYSDTHTFDLIRSRQRDQDAPLFIYVHGGGWTGGGPQKQARRMYHSLAREGWAVATLRYPLAPSATICDQVRAIKQAIHHFKTEADRYGIDPERIVLSGSSAGGHLASLTALSTSPEFHDGFEPADVAVAACIPMYGIYDMANRHKTRPDWPYVDRDVMRGSYDEKPDEFHAVSPIDHVSADAPPFLVIHGTHDSLVPIAEAEVFVDAARRAGTDVDLVRVLGAQHGFDAVSSGVSRHTAALVTTWASRRVGAMAGRSER